MQPFLTAAQLHLLRMIFDRGTEAASHALSKWLGEDLRLTMNTVSELEMAAAVELLGPPESLVAACSMRLTGWLSGLILLVFKDSSGLALFDLLMHQNIGTTTSWGELEESAAQETANIVGCAYVNALASHLPSAPEPPLSPDQTGTARPAAAGDLVPTPPAFVHEFAGSLLQFAFMEQALELDQILVIQSDLKADLPGLDLDWTLLFVPSRVSRHALAASLLELESRRF